MARTVRTHGGRLSWQAVGIGGTHLLGARIDRVLSGDLDRRPTRAQLVVLGAACVVAVLIVVACRGQGRRVVSGNAAIEQRDRALLVALERIDRQIRGDFRTADWDISAASIAALEEAVRQDPDDLGALERLLIGYWVRPPARPETRRERILWLIEHHPDSPLAGSVEARLFPRTLDAAQAAALEGDPVGYAQATRAWLAQANRPDAAVKVLDNAAYFVAADDPALAEDLLFRARRRDPDGDWAARLGALYAGVLTRTLAPSGRNTARMIDRGNPGGPFASIVRARLGESTDDVLLTSAGWFLARSGGGWPNSPITPAFWAEECFKRALQVNPGAVLAHTMLFTIGRQPQRGEPLWNPPPAQAYALVSALPERERFERLAHAARGAYQRIESLTRWEDDPLIRDRIALSRADAEKYARDGLALAPKYRDHPAYGTVVFNANMTLGALALRDGDAKTAVAYLRRAAQAPPSEELTFARCMVSCWEWHLARDLLRRGEREAVAEFSERMADINVPDRIELRAAADEIRRGQPPRYYAARAR